MGHEPRHGYDRVHRDGAETASLEPSQIGVEDRTVTFEVIYQRERAPHIDPGGFDAGAFVAGREESETLTREYMNAAGVGTGPTGPVEAICKPPTEASIAATKRLRPSLDLIRGVSR